MTLRGFQPVNEDAPVSHISYFEADTFARWSGHRLPTEFEWEAVAAKSLMDENLANSRVLRPIPAKTSKNGVAQLFGDIWEWTCSPYAAYLGFKPHLGVTSEYNGKFMSGQYILRGGSCFTFTPAAHIRPTYRNFFYPHQRWQFWVSDWEAMRE